MKYEYDHGCSTFVSIAGGLITYLHITALLQAPAYLSYTNSKEGAATNGYSSSLLRQYPVQAYQPSGPAGSLAKFTYPKLPGTPDTAAGL